MKFNLPLHDTPRIVYDGSPSSQLRRLAIFVRKPAVVPG